MCDGRAYVVQVNQVKVVGGDHTQAVSSDQRRDVRLAADQPLAVIGALENLVDQEEKRHFTALLARLNGGQQGFQTPDLGIEIRVAVGHGVADFDAGKQPEQGHVKGASVDGTTRVSQAEIDAQRA